MAVQQEIKSQLAKLLATEDIVVEHKHVETAQFNVDTRVLILPLWEKASNYVYDMLVGHEVGHALFTPNVDPPKDIPHNFLNVCEDARIEKLMKRKYLGIAKSFYRGYSEMHENDFFELDGEDIDNFNLADRANLHFKIGSFLPISFSDPEKEIITLIQNAETFTDTIAAAKALYNYCKQEAQQKTQELPTKGEEGLGEDLVDEQSTGNSTGTGDIDADISSNSDSSLSDSDSDAPLESGVGSSDSPTGVDDSSNPLEPQIQTADALMGKLKDLTGGEYSSENVYVEIPKVNLESVIIPNETVHEIADKHYRLEDERYTEALRGRGEVPEGLEYLYPDSTFQFPDSDYVKFKRDAQKEVSYLVKEFECRKSASAYARASTSRTGVLDTRQLHTYKFNEDLFKKITVLPDGKNHGLIFILDWSGSMSRVLEDTLKQLYNLIWFCKKVQIPFDVYAFSSEFRNRTDREYTEDRYDRMTRPKFQHCERKEGFLHVDSDFSLLHFFTSDSNAKTLEHQMINIWRTAHAFGRRVAYQYPIELCLSGTPLNETLVTLHQLIPHFQEKTGAEKVQCIVLTDGEGSQLPYNKMVDRAWEEGEFLGCVPCHGDRSSLRDRKLGRTYKLKHGYRDFTDALLTNLKDRFPTTNFIGIRVLEGRDARYFVGHYHYDNDKIMKEWKKNKSCTITNSGYDAYFAISSTALAQDAEFDVDDEATKAQIKRAFVKSLKTKKLNKKVLGEFIELVA